MMIIGLWGSREAMPWGTNAEIIKLNEMNVLELILLILNKIKVN